MIIEARALQGVYLLRAEPNSDHRGFFARTWDAVELDARGLCTEIAECAVAHNRARGTIRGMHYQLAPHAEVKLVTCLRGALYDVVVDIRSDSPTYRRWEAVTLTAGALETLYVPEGVAHGYQTLEDDTTLSYMLSSRYSPEHARGIRWNDPALAIEWPLGERILSARDRSYADFVG